MLEFFLSRLAGSVSRMGGPLAASSSFSSGISRGAARRVQQLLLAASSAPSALKDPSAVCGDYGVPQLLILGAGGIKIPAEQLQLAQPHSQPHTNST